MAKLITEYQADARAFWKGSSEALALAVQAGVFESGQELARLLKAQLQRKFRRGPDSDGNFFKAVKATNLPATGEFGPASYVRLGVPFMDAFEEGKTIAGKGYLVVLLKMGQKLRFRRITKGNTWAKVWAKIEKNAFLYKTQGGVVVFYKYQGKRVPIYFLVRQVKLKKRISFFALAQQVGEGLAERIANKLPGGGA